MPSPGPISRRRHGRERGRDDLSPEHVIPPPFPHSPLLSICPCSRSMGLPSLWPPQFRHGARQHYRYTMKGERMPHTHHHPRRRLISMVGKPKIPCGLCLRIRPPAASSNYQPRKNDRVKQAIRFLAVRSDHGSIGHRRPPIAVHARREKTPHRSQARPEPAVSAENLKGAIAATLLFRARRLTVARKREVDDSRERELRGSTLDTVIGGRPIEAQART